MDPLVTSALISTGGNAAAAGGSILSQALFGKRNERWARQDATTAYDRAVAQWNRENEYNSPKAQMQRYIDAGLNPNLIYGSMSSGAVGLPSVPHASTNQSVPAPIPQDILSPLLESKLMKAQIDNLDSSSELSRSQAYRIYQITPAEFEKIQADADSIRQMILSNEFQTKVNQFKSAALDDSKTDYGLLYGAVDQYGNNISANFRDLVLDTYVKSLISSNADYTKAIELFETEIGIRKGEASRIKLENQKLEEFVKVCSRIYESDAAQADYLREIAELNRELFGNLGASSETIRLVFGFLSLILGKIK